MVEQCDGDGGDGGDGPCGGVAVMVKMVRRGAMRRMRQAMTRMMNGVCDDVQHETDPYGEADEGEKAATSLRVVAMVLLMTITGTNGRVMVMGREYAGGGDGG